MRVEQLGDGDPEIAIVGGIHGDEPCGVRAIERLLEERPAVERPVKLIVAHEAAVERGVRYLDADLNRAFDSFDPETREHHLARRLAEAVAGCVVLSIHSTQSHPEPFAIVGDVDEPARSLCPRLPVEALVVIDDGEGRPFALEAADFIEVEAGRQGTDAAAENASRIARAFLAATGALPDPAPTRELPVFRLGEPIEKSPGERYEVCAENFDRVDAGEAFARIDGEPVVADDPFYPILVSAEGYEDQFGYAGERVGTLAVPGEE